MSQRCDGCGVDVVEGSKFCPNCGKPMKVAAGQPEKPAGDSAVPPPAGPAPAAVPPASIAAVVPPAAAPGGTPLPVDPVPVKPGGPNIKLIAGCGGVGCLVIVVAIIIAIVVLVRHGNNNGGSEEGSGDTPQQPEEPNQGDRGDQPARPDQPDKPDQPNKPNKPRFGPLKNDPSENVPKEGGLSQLVQKEVGRFRLVKTQRMNDVIGQGAVDALKLEYRADDGSGALHLLIAWPDAGQAGQAVDATADSASKQGWKKDEEGTVRSQDGQKVGQVVILSNKKNKAQLCLWNHGQVFASVMAPIGAAKEFLNAVRY